MITWRVGAGATLELVNRDDPRSTLFPSKDGLSSLWLMTKCSWFCLCHVRCVARNRGMVNGTPP